MDPAELAARRIAERGHEALVTWLRPVVADAVAGLAPTPELKPAELERILHEVADRAEGVVWRRALAEVAMSELELELGDAAAHPVVQRAQEILGVPPYGADPGAQPQPPSEIEPRALRVAAVHLGGIETLRAGARNLELRFSDAGLDVVNTHDGSTIGRLTWDEITALEVPRRRRALRPRRARPSELIVRTDRGQASFELPGLSEDQVRRHVAPLSVRARGARSVEDPP